MSYEHNRHALLHQMTPPTQEVAQFVESIIAAEQRNGLLIRHELGLRLKQVIDEKCTYGSQAVQQIAGYLSVSPDRLYKLCAYAESYRHEQLEQWASRVTSKGGRLSYNHLIALLVVKTAAERLRVVDRIFEYSLSVRALRALLGEERNATPAKSARTKKTILSGLDQMISRGKGMLKGLSSWQRTVFNEIDKPNRRTIAPVVRNRIIEAQMMFEELSAEVAAARNNLTRTLARVDQMLG